VDRLARRYHADGGRWLAHSLAAVAAEHGADITRLLGVQVTIPTIPFPRVTFPEAHSIVREAGLSLPKGDDLGPEAERALSAYFTAKYGHEFVFVTDYPAGDSTICVMMIAQT